MSTPAKLAKLLEGNSSTRQQIDDDETKPSPTVEELLRMFTDKAKMNARPPPIPPKPIKTRTNLNNRNPVPTEDNNCDQNYNVIEPSFRRYSRPVSDEQSTSYESKTQTSHTINSNSERLENSARTTVTISSAKTAIYDVPTPSPYYAPKDVADIPQLKSHSPTHNYVQIRPYEERNSNRSDLTFDVDGDRAPFVTESSEDNEIMVVESRNGGKSKRNRANNVSTVKISEVPYTSKTTVSNVNPTFSRSAKHNNRLSNEQEQQQQQLQQSQLYYENNAYPVPIVTSATDDEDTSCEYRRGEFGRSNDANATSNESHKSRNIAPPIEVEVDSIINESASSYPPRTSTPNASTDELDSHANIEPKPAQRQANDVEQCLSRVNLLISNDCDSTNAASAKAAVTSKPDVGSFVEELASAARGIADSDNDTINRSRDDTDDLNNTSALNQSSGGCELIGVNDNSDASNNAKSPRFINNTTTTLDDHQQVDALPKSQPQSETTTSNFFSQTTNDTGMSASSLSPHTNSQNDQSLHSNCEEKIKELEKFQVSLLDCIDKLKNEVIGLTSKVDCLESKVAEQKALETSRNTSSFSLTANSTPNRASDLTHSKSISAINKLGSSNSASKTSNYNSHISSNHSPFKTYSRQLASSRASTSQLAASPAPASCNSNTVTRHSRHISTSSLHHDASRNSPTNHLSHLQSDRLSSRSPLTLRGRGNDPMAYTSMLSLNSLGSNYTLNKKSVAGSVSNLSQNDSQLSSWPSLSSFIQSKQRAKEISLNEEKRTIKMTLYDLPITIRIPDWVQRNYEFESIAEPPNVRIKLDWVYGYRGRDCRSNLFYLPTGECIYFVASIIVLYNLNQRKQRHYLGHTDNVKCLAVHPNKLIVASGQSATASKGGKRPIVRVWNTVSLATIRVIGFNEDFDRPICCLAFSKNDQGATLAVVDESSEHTITLLDWQRENSWRLAEANSGHEQVLAIDFHPFEKGALVAVGKGSINFWDVRGMSINKKMGLFDKYDKPRYVLCMTFNDFGDTISGDSNGNIVVWPHGGNKPKQIVRAAHDGGVFSILAMKDGTYLTGGRDRRIVEWDDSLNATGREIELPEHCGGVRYLSAAQGDHVLIGTLRNAILYGSLDTNFSIVMQGHVEAVSALAVHPNQASYLTGGFDEQAHLFDARTHEVLWSKCIMMPVTAAAFTPNGSMLILGSTHGKWCVMDVLSQETLFSMNEGTGTINCIKFSPDTTRFAMGSSDMQVYIYEVSEDNNKFMRVGACAGHSAPIKEIDWSEESTHMQTQSMNFELLYWNASTCKPLEDQEHVGNLKWATHNCTIGFEVVGIWTDPMDSTLINCCDRSTRNDMIVSASDTGNINIFKWPACYNQCLSQRFYANVHKLNYIKFLRHDAKIVAVGSKSCVTTEWTIEQPESSSSSSSASCA